MSATAAAQMARGGLVGVVRDAQGGVLAGATVTITEVGTNLVREAVTDAQGGYNFVNVLPGRYAVKVTMPSFRETVRTGVPVTVGQISRVDVTLEVGGLAETVTVQSEAQLLQTDRADIRTDLKSEEISNLPLNQFRNYQVGADGFYYDPAAWAQPQGVRFGDTRINQFRGPGGWNLDLSVFRSFPLRGSHRLETGIEATNVTDTPVFGNPTSGITSGDFMRIFSLNNAFTERRIRLGLRYSF